jgi:hypothetical protein
LGNHAEMELAEVVCSVGFAKTNPKHILNLVEQRINFVFHVSLLYLYASLIFFGNFSAGK